MKTYFNYFVLIFLCFNLINCATYNNFSNEFHRQWMLVEFKDFSKEELVSHKANIDFSMTKSNPNQYNAYMGCNRIFFITDIKSRGRINFSKISSTMMYCENASKLEELFLKELPKMTHYKIEGHFLTLSNQSGNRMKLIAADWD